MTTLAGRAALGAPRGGGVAARRAVVRWAGRMFRREWRQQLLVLTLLTVSVAVAIGSITLVYNTGATADNAAEFGSATTQITVDGSDPRTLAAVLPSVKKAFGATDVIRHRSIPVPGGVEKVDFRAQDPDGAYGHDLLAPRRGDYPKGPRQIAVTDGVAKLLQLGIGKTTSLDGNPRTVVGIVENPRKLSDEFALVPPASAGATDQATILVGASPTSIDAFMRSLGDRARLVSVMMRGNDNRAADTLAMFSVATVFLLLASLVAAAGFAVVAQRRLRQLGMLAAVGATEKQLRLVLVANGAVVGAVAALLGTIVGLLLWVRFAPTLESAVDHRIDRLSLPWGLIGGVVLLALVGATAAAWWPGRTASRLPVVLALSGRPPRPRPVRHSAVAAAVLIGIGIAALALSDRDASGLIVAGIVTVILGCLLLGPPAIRVFSALAGRVPVAPRLALRDLVRYQARSGAALAAVTLALGIAITVVVIASAEHAKQAAEPLNFTDRQIRVYTGPPELRKEPAVLAGAELNRAKAGVERMARDLDGATVIPLTRAFQPGEGTFTVGGTRVRPTVQAARRTAGPDGQTGYRVAVELYLATPAVLRYLGVDPAGVHESADFLADRSVRTEGLVVPSFKGRRDLPLTHVQRIQTDRRLFGSTKGPMFITPDGLRRRGWHRIAGGWLVESRPPLTSAQIAGARERASTAGLGIEAKREDDSPTRAMAIAITAGALLALGILAMTVGLIRSESAGDLRTLTATGATPRIRRALTATTAGALALLGALLGVAGAYVVLAATYYDDLGYLSHVPILYLGLALIGLPLAAGAAGWLLSGREPPAISRTVMD
jgi:putative ABC transport system permease protein